MMTIQLIALSYQVLLIRVLGQFINLPLTLFWLQNTVKKAINQERLVTLKEIFEQTLVKWDCLLIDFNSESDHCHLIVEFKPDIELSKLIANLKTVSSRL